MKFDQWGSMTQELPRAGFIDCLSSGLELVELAQEVLLTRNLCHTKSDYRYYSQSNNAHNKYKHTMISLMFSTESSVFWENNNRKIGLAIPWHWSWYYYNSVSAQNESGPLPKVVAKYIFANRRGPLLLHGLCHEGKHLIVWVFARDINDVLVPLSLLNFCTF